MGKQCSTCRTINNEKAEQIQNVTNQKLPSPQAEKKEPIPVQKKKQEILNDSNPSESKSDKKLNKKRVQIIMPMSQFTENKDNVKFKQNSIETSDAQQIKKSMSRHFILSQLQEKETAFVISKMRYCTVTKDQFVFKQGDQSSSYYIILEGSCSVIINGQSKKTLNFGDSFGDLGIIYNAPRSASIQALENCLLASMNTKTFKQVTQDLNSLYEKENRKFLETVDFYKQLNEEEKNALASDCLNETYEENKTIFNKGDDANSFYIVKEGKVLIVQKNIQLGPLESFGKNSVLHQNRCVRTNSIIAKTKCKLISINKQIIRKNLGDSLSRLLKKKEVITIVKQNEIYAKYESKLWNEAFSKIQFVCLRKGAIAFPNNSQIPLNKVYVLIGTDLKDDEGKKIYMANSIIESDKILKDSPVSIQRTCFAEFDGFLGKFQLILQKQTLKEEEKKTKTLEKSMNLNDFLILRKLRSGNFGQVYACYNAIIKKKYAIKVMDREEIESTGITKYILNEQQILRETPPHPFLVKFYKLLKDKHFIYIIMDLLEGEDMFDTMNTMLPIPANLTRFYIMQIVMVIEHLHKNRIIYRDLKPQNLMMTKDGYLTLVDMGTSKKLSIQKRYKTSTIIGTPHYMAPEIITGKGYSFSIDLWSLGVVMYEFLIGKLPFGDNLEDPFNIYEEIIKSQIKYPRSIDQNTKSILNRLLSKNVQARLGNGYDELKNHPYFGGQSWEQILKKNFEPSYKPSQQTQIKDIEIQKALKKTNSKAVTRFLKDRNKR